MKVKFFVASFLLCFFTTYHVSYASKFFEDIDGMPIQSSWWRKNICCCLGPSREEKANHYFHKAKMSFFYDENVKKTKKNLEMASFFGHTSAIYINAGWEIMLLAGKLSSFLEKVEFLLGHRDSIKKIH